MSEEFASLFDHSVASAFQHPIWLDRVYATLVLAFAADPRIVVVRSRADGRLVLMLPLVLRRHGIARVVEFADFGVSDYAAPICSAETLAQISADPDACARIRRAIGPFDLIRIQKLRDDLPPIDALLGTRPRTVMDMSAHAVPLQASYDAWREENVSRSYRKELDKKHRQLNRKGELRFARAEDAKAIQATLEAMRTYRASWFRDDTEGDLLQKSAYFDFYRQIAERGRNTLARTYALTLDGRPIAGVVALVHSGRCLIVLGGFDHTEFKNYSLGAQMFEAVARDCMERGDKVLDFTIGDEPYKRMFGATPSSMYMISGAGSPLGLVTNAVVDRIPWAKSLARRLVRRSALAATAAPVAASLMDRG